MITGDQEPTAIAVAKEIGIIESDKDLIVKGEDFALMTDEELEKIIEEVKVYSRMSPKDKYRVVYGDLRLETIDAKRLPEIDKRGGFENGEMVEEVNKIAEDTTVFAAFVMQPDDRIVTDDTQNMVRVWARYSF